MKYLNGYRLFTHVSCTLILVLCLAGCGVKDVRFFPASTRPSASVNGTRVTIQPLSRDESTSFFGCDVLGEAGCYPLVMTIENNTANSYLFKPSYLPLQRVSGKDVSKLMHYDTYQRIFWLTAPALIFWWPAIPFLIVPYGLSCSHYNEKTTRALRKRTLGANDTLMIAPYETVQRFIFVPRQHAKSVFGVKLFNETTHTVEEFPTALVYYA